MLSPLLNLPLHVAFLACCLLTEKRALAAPGGRKGAASAHTVSTVLRSLASRWLSPQHSSANSSTAGATLSSSAPMEACSPPRAAFMEPRHLSEYSELASQVRTTFSASDAAANLHLPARTAAASPHLPGRTAHRPLPRTLLLHQVLACLCVLHAANLTAFSWGTTGADSQRWAQNAFYLVWAATILAGPSFYWRHRCARTRCLHGCDCPHAAGLLSKPSAAAWLAAVMHPPAPSQAAGAARGPCMPLHCTGLSPCLHCATRTSVLQGRNHPGLPPAPLPVPLLS